MPLNPTYSVGTATVSAGSAVVTGVGMLFVASGVRPGDVFERAGLSITIASVDSNTQITLVKPWPGTSGSGIYEIRFVADASRVLSNARLAIELFQQVQETNVRSYGAVGNGIDDDSLAFQAAADFAKQNKLGRVIIPAGDYRVAGVDYGAWTVWTGDGDVTLTLPDGANTYMFKASGFDQWADSIPTPPSIAPTSIARTFAWHSSPAARNSIAAANGYVVGSIVVTHPTNPRDLGWEVGERWWLATSVAGGGFATTNANWIEVPSLLGAIRSGFENVVISGNRANQTAGQDLICHYGIAPHFSGVRIRDGAKWGLFAETAGGTFSPQVGISQQGLWNDVRVFNCGDSATGNFYYNGQSDTDFVNLQCYATPEGGTDLYVGAKASGSRFRSGHIYGLGGSIAVPTPTSRNWGIKSDAQACDWSMHIEVPIWLNGARHQGQMKIYRANAASQMDTAAVWLNNPSMCDLSVRTYMFREVFRIEGADQGDNFLSGQLSHAGGKTGTGVISPNGQAASASSIVMARNSVNSLDNYVAIEAVRGNITDPASASTMFGFNSTGPRVTRSNVEQLLFTGTEVVNRIPPRLPSYTVAALPTSGINNGALAYASNGRKSGEASGAGTGVIVYRSSGWRVFGTDAAVTA